MVVINGWVLRQVDVNNVFLNGTLIEEIYMDQPLGFKMYGANREQLKKHVLDLLHSKGMAAAIATPTPMVGSPKLTVADGSPLINVHEYRSVIGKLQYACITRPEIAFYFDLVGYIDANWASTVEDRISTTSYCIYLGSNPVAWCSKKQVVVSRSSSEAEY
ncbi:putative LRR receptor-like serine/threonine-protein kinase [Gossypium australe]|uniref:Putative LRR receptor-like serine/threonine-protein kinase n=1 Tax=Gossypium australe TaxID=47621 RepID=A0A5B6V9F4_9ROSI|nr:putative LRR receptor-like serine/threonine-protein kinase [Gossypium australe]